MMQGRFSEASGERDDDGESGSSTVRAFTRTFRKEIPTCNQRFAASASIHFQRRSRPVETDVLLAASDFVRGTFERHLSETFVVPASCALSLPGEIGANREAFELPANGTLFFTGFDPGSDPERKNPFGAVRAFWRAFGGSRDAYLVVKVNNAVRNGVRHPVADQLKALCRGHGNILVIDRVMSYADALSLLASCDVYVSLHRAEGLGLGLMEAMCLGKPVIATAWSGNMSFMDHANSCLVGYRLIPVNSTLPAYRQFNGKTQWAEPSEERAAAWMRELARDPELRIRIGLNAKRSVSAYDAAARAGHFLDELEAIALHAAFLPRRVLPPPADLWRAARGPVKGVFAGVRGEVTRQWRRHIGWRLQ